MCVQKITKASAKAGAFLYANIFQKCLILRHFWGMIEEKWRKVGRKSIKVV